MNKYLLTVLLLITISYGAFSQEFRKAEPVVCPADPNSYDTFVAPTVLKGLNNRSANIKNSNIVVNYNGFTDEARIAFQYAVDIWATLLKSPTPIVVNANFSDLGEGVLGSAGPSNYVRDFEGAPVDTTFYPIPLAEKLAGYSLNDENDADLNANFSSTFNFYFGLDGNPPSYQYDFVSIVLHELGHGLGFTGAVSFNENASPSTASWDLGTTGKSSIYTKFTQLGDGTLIINLPASGEATAEAFTSNNLFFNGSVATASLGEKPKLYAPSSWNGGSSFSHLDEATYRAGDPNSLMSPQIGAGEAIHDPGVSLDIFADMGWVHTYLSHENNNAITNNITDPFLVSLTVKSDTSLSTIAPNLYYTETDFSAATKVVMTLDGANFVANIPNPGTSSTIKYYFDGVVDGLGRAYTSPSSAPEKYHIINIINSQKKSLPYLITDGGNFETNSDFTPIALDGNINIWEKGTPTNTLNNIPSGTTVWKTDLDGNIGQPASSFKSALISPVFDFSNTSLNHELSFKFSMENAFTEDVGLFESGPLGLNLQYTLDGGASWSILGVANDKRGTNWYNKTANTAEIFPAENPAGWIKQTIEVIDGDTTFVTEDVSYNVSFLTGNTDVQFRFVYYVAQDYFEAGYEADGVLIDDFEIKTSNPTADFIVTTNELIYAGNEVLFEHISVGANSYLWDFGDGTTSTLPSPIHIYSNGGTYDVSLTIQSDAGEIVEIKQDFIEVIAIYNAPYLLADGGDLEGAVTDFNIQNVSGTGFELGSSSIAGKAGTASGSNAFVTSISKNQYANDSEAYIYTPEFNLAAVGTYEFSFETNYQFEPNWDGFIVEYTIDRGQNWVKLNDVEEEGWYNQISDPQSVFGISVPIFSGTTSNIFEKKHTDISFLQGAGNVGFRIKFLTDAAEVDAGMAIDNFQITYAEPLPITTGFEASTIGACIDENVIFTNSSTGSIAAVSWDFGLDASPSTAEGLDPVSVQYSTTGSKTITLTVTDLYGVDMILEKTAYVTVGDLHSPSFTTGERAEDLSVLLTASAGDAYQWRYNGLDIEGANKQTHLASADSSGIYSVAVTINNCTVETEIQNVITSSKSAFESSFIVFPNPIKGSDYFNYKFSNEYIGSYQVYIHDLSGRILYQESFNKSSNGESKSISTNNFKNGIYFIRLITGSEESQRKLVISK